MPFPVCSTVAYIVKNKNGVEQYIKYKLFTQEIRQALFMLKYGWRNETSQSECPIHFSLAAAYNACPWEAFKFIYIQVCLLGTRYTYAT